MMMTTLTVASIMMSGAGSSTADALKQAVLQGHDEHLTKAAAFDPTGKFAFTTDEKGTIRRWDLERMACDLALSTAHAPVFGVTCSGDRRVVAWTCRDGVCVWDPARSADVQFVEAGPPRLVGPLLISGSKLYAGDGKGIRRLDLESMRWDGEVELEAYPRLLKKHPTLNKLFAGHITGEVSIIDLDSLKVELFRAWDGRYPVTNLAFSSDGKFFATAIGSLAIRVWRTEDRGLVREVKPTKSLVGAISLSDDGSRIVCSYAGFCRVTVWNVSDGAMIADRDIERVEGTIVDEEMSADGKVILRFGARILGDVRHGFVSVVRLK